jgi:2-C-methyl-D-erythritol 4-phosphate cytidylyltransferase
MRIAAIVVAAGAGERFGARKQFCDVAGVTAAARSVDAARAVASLVVLVAPLDALDDAHGADVVVAGGATRAASVRAGLRALADLVDDDVVVVHDAARPLASAALFHAVVDALADGAIDGAVPGLALTDTVKRVRSSSDALVVATVPRDDLVAVQTPQAFRLGVLRRAHEGAPEGTDDASLVEVIGRAVLVVPGEVRNRKLTTRDDAVAVLALLETAT